MGSSHWFWTGGPLPRGRRMQCDGHHRLRQTFRDLPAASRELRSRNLYGRSAAVPVRSTFEGNGALLMPMTRLAALAAAATALLVAGSAPLAAQEKLRFAVGPFQPTQSDTRKA